MTILAHSLNGPLRLRPNKKGDAGVVELRNHLRAGDWFWCVYRSQPIEKAWELFQNQCKFHTDHSSTTEQPGV